MPSLMATASALTPDSILWCAFSPYWQLRWSVKRPYWVKARRNSGNSSTSKVPIFSGIGPRLHVRWLLAPRSTTAVESAPIRGALASAKRVMPLLSPSASSKARPSTSPVSSTVWCSSTHVSPLASTVRSMPEWWASRCRRWSRNPTPVATSAFPPPSSSRLTLTNVSAVSRSALPLRAISLPALESKRSNRQPLPHPIRDARGVVPEAFEAGEAFHVRSEVSQGVPGEVNVVRPGEEVVGPEGGGPGSGPAGGQGVGRTGRIVAERDGAEVPHGDHADGVEVPHHGLVVVRDHMR